LIPVEAKSEVHNVLSPAILKIALIEELLTTSNGAYKSVRRAI